MTHLCPAASAQQCKLYTYTLHAKYHNCRPNTKRLLNRHRRHRAPFLAASQAPGLQRLPSSGDLRNNNSKPPVSLPVPEPFSLTVAQLQALIAPANSGKVYSSGVVSTAEELAKRLGSSVRKGIPSQGQDTATRQKLYGVNSLPKREETTFWEYVLEALDDYTVKILLVAGIVSIYLQTVLDTTTENGWIEGTAILAAVVVVVLVTAVNNYQKELQFKQLNELQSDVMVRVIRNGKEVEISSADLLVGDLLCVDTGDILQADGVLITGHNVRLDESNLTGESEAMKKDTVRNPCLYSGSKVLEGLGRMLVTAVGPNSQQGVIMTLATSGGAGPVPSEDSMGLREQTNLQNQLEVLAQQIGGLGLVAGLLAIFVSSATFSYDTFFVQHLPWSWVYLNTYLHFVILGITILVVAIPEGLPLAVTIGLAYSVKRMLTDNNLVRHLGAAETMGCATTICCDKTGTLTQNDMAVVRACVAGVEVKDARKGRLRLQERKQQLLAMDREAAAVVSTQAAAAVSSSDAPQAAAEDLERVGSGAQASTSQPSSGVAGTDDENASARTNGSLLTTLPAAYAPPTVNFASSVLPLDNIDPRTVQLLCDAIAVNSTAQLVYDPQTGSQEKRGNRTECALLEFAEAMGADVLRIREAWEVSHLFPFSSERKRMSTLAYQPAHRLDGMTCAKLFVKGAAEIVLSMCDNQLCADGSVKAMTEDEKQQLLASFGKDGRRMLCIAYRDMMLPSWHEEEDPPQVGEQQAEQHLTFLAMCGLEDPLRPEVKQAIKQLQRAGITVKMLTGDNAITAFSIARQCGIVAKDAPLPKYVSSGKGAAGWKKKVLEYLAEEQASTGSPVNGSPPSSSAATSAAVVNAPASSGSSALTNGSGTGQSLERRVNGTASVSLASESLMSGPMLGSLDGKATNPDEDFLVMESSLFQKLILNADGTINYQAFDIIWPRLRVLARCTPLDKYTIVNACKNRPTEVVAMTGDGTNDAPALRLANVGFAMASGTSIAKEASDILLLDDNLNSIVQAVKWGRNVYAGATKFLQFQLTINVGAVVTATAGAFVLRESPLAAIQMLWINLVMDSLASLSLATETPTDDVLDQPPYATNASLVTPTVLKNIVGQTVFQLGVMYWLVFVSPSVLGYPDGSFVEGASVHYTMVFNTFVMMQLFNQVNARKLRDELNILNGLAQDQLFLIVLGSETVIQYLLVEYGGQAFNCQSLDLQQWGVCIGFGAVGLLIREALRYIPVGTTQLGDTSAAVKSSS